MKIILLSLIIVFSISNLFAWEWPDEPDRIISSFGLSWSGRFERGLRFRAVGQRVLAWNSGELVWINQSENSGISGQSIMVLEHENGFRSIYRGLENRPGVNRSVGQGEWIGYAGGESWQFQIVDTLNSRLVNPAILLPQDKYSGNGLPVEARLSMGNSSLPIQNDTNVPPGYRDLSIMGIVPAIIPIQLTVYWQNKELTSLMFNTLTVKNNTVVIGTPVERTFQEVYDNYNRLIIRDILPDSDEFIQGNLMIQLEGARGNMYTWSWNLRSGVQNNENIFQDTPGQ